MKCIERRESISKKKIYPRLMKGISSGHIYLMENETDGIRIKCGNMMATLGWQTNLTPSALEDFDGTVELSNE